ncbi:hypothetical protein BDV18DRAFT_40920 [Aspergillus unguis]
MSYDYDYDYDYENDPYSGDHHYYDRRQSDAQGYYTDHYEPQDPSHYYPSSSAIPRDRSVLNQPTSTWDPSSHSFREDRPHYTHASTWSGDTHAQPGSLTGDPSFDGGHIRDFGHASQQPRSGRPHSRTHPTYTPPVAQSINSRASQSAPSANQNPEGSGYLSSQNILDPRYVVQPRSYYSLGKVFAVLWHENDGRGTGTGTVASRGPKYIGRFGQPIFSTIRRMVAIKVLDQCSWCIAINTYGGQGVAKRGIDESKHAIVYIKDTTPIATDDEPPMVKEPLAVTPDNPGDRLDEMSRLNFGKIYTVEHNVKVLPIGKISSRSMTRFRQYARAELALDGP